MSECQPLQNRQLKKNSNICSRRKTKDYPGELGTVQDSLGEFDFISTNKNILIFSLYLVFFGNLKILKTKLEH